MIVLAETSADGGVPRGAGRGIGYGLAHDAGVT